MPQINTNSKLKSILVKVKIIFFTNFIQVANGVGSTICIKFGKGIRYHSCDFDDGLLSEIYTKCPHIEKMTEYAVTYSTVISLGYHYNLKQN